MQLTPNLEMNFGDMPFLDRIDLSADLGFTGGDMFFTKDKDVAKLGARLRKHNFTIGMVVGSGIAVGLNDAANHAEIVDSVEAAARDAAEIGALHVTVLSGNRLPKVADAVQDRNIIDGLKRLAPIAEKYNVNIVLEILNSLYDHPGYYLDSTEKAFNIVRAVSHDKVKVLYDIYHVGVMRGNIIEDIRGGMDVIGHFHIAGIPGRNEPKNGEQNYPVIWREIEKLGYDGHVSMEYAPLLEPRESLTQTRDWILGKA